MVTHARSSLTLLATVSIIAVGCSSKGTRNDAGTPAVSSTPAATNTANGTVDTALQPQHHSKAKGALLGGAAGAAIGGKKGALLGAVVGAEAQHHRNKVEQRRATGY